MRLVSAAVTVGMLTFFMVLLVRGDGPGSGQMVLGISRSHGINTGDIPVLVAWLLGVVATWILYARR